MIVLFFLTAVGITTIIIRGSIFERLRKTKPDFWECPMCIGFYVGIFLQIIFIICNTNLFGNILIGTIISSFSTSLLSWLLHNLIGGLGFNIDISHTQIELEDERYEKEDYCSNSL